MARWRIYTSVTECRQIHEYDKRRRRQLGNCGQLWYDRDVTYTYGIEGVIRSLALLRETL